MNIKSYQRQPEMLLKDFLLADSFIIYTSVIGGIFACKMVYDVTHFVSIVCFKSYSSLSKSKQIEWNSRSLSTFHAVFITIMSLYIAFWSDLYSDNRLTGLVTYQSTPLSTFALGVSVGYFLTDLGMILWYYPSLGGLEYVLHHLLSLVGVSYSMLTGEGQLYTYMILASEMTTPGINLRWYLDIAGLKKSQAYLINGVVIFFTWLVARILLFIYLFYHMYLHYDQVQQLHTVGFLLALVGPSVFSVMNLVWFWKIINGLKKALAKRH